MAAAEHLYQYERESSWSPAGGLALATAGGREAHPSFFRGFVDHAGQAARAVLTVAEVARTRYHDPGVFARMRDPVVTSNRSVLRFEAFSACNGVYARFDLDAAGFDGERLDWGTTNVDVNEPLRAALAGIATGEPMRLSVGTGHLEVETLDGSVVERRVPLPDRWLKGFAEVQIAAAGMVQVAELGVAGARAAIRDLSAARTGNQSLWVAFPAGGARLSRRADAAAPSLVGPQRLATLRRLLPDVRGLAVFTTPLVARRGVGGRPGAADVLRPSAWVVELDRARLTLVLSPELHRGFSGEGAVLPALAGADGSTVDDVAGLLGGQARLDPEALAAAAGVSVGAATAALQVLGAAGRVGYDLAAGGFFHRDLPFDRSSLEGVHPRLRDAAALLDAGAVRAAGRGWTVDSGDAAYTVRSDAEGYVCLCPWFAKHRGERGPCKHVLAVQLGLARVQS